MSGYTAKAWMTIASGGRWTVPEVKKALPREDPKLVENAVRAMLASGMVIRYEGTQPTYGVTKECTIPRGVSVKEVFQVMGVA
jgi:hypothetical protein